MEQIIRIREGGDQRTDGAMPHMIWRRKGNLAASYKCCQVVQRTNFHFCLVDEADSILIDEDCCLPSKLF
eukprot:1885711-Amphidinium_carterae.1